MTIQTVPKGLGDLPHSFLRVPEALRWGPVIVTEDRSEFFVPIPEIALPQIRRHGTESLPI